MEALIVGYLLKIIVGASVLHVVLPPYEVLNDFPEAQKYYKVFLGVVQYAALNLRTQLIQVYPQAKAALQGGEVEPKQP